MLPYQNVVIILISLIFCTGWKTTTSKSYTVDYSKPTILEASPEASIVNQFLRSKKKRNFDESLIFKNDQLLVRKTLIESDQVGGEIAYV